MDQVKVKIAKNRNGMLDEFPLLFTGKNTKFSDMLDTEESE
jgi:replicative DNA helicase